MVIFVPLLTFPMVVYNLISIPIRLPHHDDLLTPVYSNKKHSLGKQLRVISVVLSG